MNVGNINLPAVETTFGRNENRKQGKFLLEQENKTKGLRNVRFP